MSNSWFQCLVSIVKQFLVNSENSLISPETAVMVWWVLPSISWYSSGLNLRMTNGRLAVSTNNSIMRLVSQDVYRCLFSSFSTRSMWVKRSTKKPGLFFEHPPDIVLSLVKILGKSFSNLWYKWCSFVL